MNRAPNTNGTAAQSVRARGGYDAYFAQQVAVSDDATADPIASVDLPDTPIPPDETPKYAVPQHDSPTTEPHPAQPHDAGASPPARSPDAPTAVSARPPEQIPVRPTPHAEPVARPPAAAQAAYQSPVPPRPQANPSSTPSWDANHTRQQTWDHTAAAYAPPPAATPRVPDRISHDTRGAYDPRGEVGPRVEVLPSALSQDLFAEIAAIKQAKLKSNSGMRGALNKVGFNLGLSPAEQRFQDRRARIRHQLSTPSQIAVVSVKGGVGRTTVTAALGSTFAHLRPDRVVAIDANPDFGDLSTRTTRHPYGLTLRDLAQSPNLEAFSAVHSFTSINSADLSVIASPWTTESVEALSGPEFHSAAEVLRRHYNLLMVDCGTGVLDSVTGTVLQTSDAVVVVTPATVGGVKGAVATLNWLASHGFQELVAKSVVVIVHHRPDRPIVEVAEIEKLFATVSRPTCVVPYDAHLAEGGEIDLRLLDKDTAVVFEELAATLADNFPGFLDTRQGGSPGQPGGNR